VLVQGAELRREARLRERERPPGDPELEARDRLPAARGRQPAASTA